MSSYNSAECAYRCASSLRGLIADEGDDHAVEVEEEHDKVKAQLEERLLHFVSIKSTALYYPILPSCGH